MFRSYSLNDFYRSCAIAMLNWQQVEASLFRLYFGLLSDPNLRQAGAAFFSLDSFGAKLRLVDATAMVVLNGAALKKWSELRKHVLTASGERNVLAHLPATVEVQADKSLSLVLASPIFVPASLMRKRKKKYDAKECEHLGGILKNLLLQLTISPRVLAAA